METLSPTLLQRFESKLKPEGDCIVFTGCRNDKGYGEIGIGRGDDQNTNRKALAHRVAWRLHYGVWPTGTLRHTCDNPPCIRIKHLRDGTQIDNIDDKVAKGRQGKGEQISQHKLTEAQVLEIRELCKTRTALRAIAEAYGVDPMTVSSIKEGRAWRHLPYEKTRKPYSCQHIEINDGLWTIAEIAEHTGLSKVAIRSRLKRGLTGDFLLARSHCAPRNHQRIMA